MGSPQRRFTPFCYLHDILVQTQKASPDATEWMRWFLGCLDKRDNLGGSGSRTPSATLNSRVVAPTAFQAVPHPGICSFDGSNWFCIIAGANSPR